MNDLRSKRRQRQFGDLEELLPEGDPDHRAAPEEADEQVIHRHPQSAENDPYHIGQRGKPSAAVDDIFPERPEGQAGELEALKTGRNADKRNTAQQAGQQPHQPAEKTAENKPQKITYRLHNPIRPS